MREFAIPHLKSRCGHPVLRLLVRALVLDYTNGIRQQAHICLEFLVIVRSALGRLEFKLPREFDIEVAEHMTLEIIYS